MVTRYVVGLEQGGEVVVVRQNVSGPEPAEREGQPAAVAWAPGHTFDIEPQREEDE